VKKSRLDKPAPSRLPALLAAAGRLVAVRKFGEALAAYDRVVASYPVSAEAHFNRAVALFRHGRADDAIAFLRHFLEQALVAHARRLR
jgi:tetratricopeptide (TPR) repeat protein